MTATVVELRSTGRHAPSFFDRIVMRASLTTLMWARHRADRTALARELRLERLTALCELERRGYQPYAVTSRQTWPTPR
ncbi:MAG: hypothetical protein V4479_05800 [Actinomycetota bacterium]